MVNVFYRLVHAITPLEENKSFLEKVKLGEKLCGIPTSESFLLGSTAAKKKSPLADESRISLTLKGNFSLTASTLHRGTSYCFCFFCSS